MTDNELGELANAVSVQVEPVYHAQESSTAQQRYVFSYTVTLRNHSSRSVQLLTRYWKITQGSGKVQEVRGKGVVGKQPLIEPGKLFHYTSRAVLDGPVGVMQGCYTFIDTRNQRSFEVPIAPFRLAIPHQVH
ncbi:Co2+/Mg2+ efflux protein ApaG [Pistricoccus aurantiacus]|uniref:Protein ApaG n=1 Tax=Pistricoccus aurantiacus TaxID=1883414 RepID=A0A5B8SPP5_9GAMM|nr:Co2+/Mg2+ efflux protein ApaG [Pistricoccus aurantiacus]